MLTALCCAVLCCDASHLAPPTLIQAMFKQWLAATATGRLVGNVISIKCAEGLVEEAKANKLDVKTKKVCCVGWLA